MEALAHKQIVDLCQCNNCGKEFGYSELIKNGIGNELKEECPRCNNQNWHFAPAGTNIVPINISFEVLTTNGDSLASLKNKINFIVKTALASENISLHNDKIFVVEGAIAHIPF